VSPAPADGDFPHIVESHGEAPPQYPNWDEEADDWDEEDGGEEADEGDEEENER
jgi:hypothetical protein